MLTATKMQANEPLLPVAHATLVKFGYPRTLVHQGQHWAVLVRPAQPTLGSLVLCALADKTAYGDLPAAAFAEQAALVGRIEQLLRGFVSYEKVNYLMLMMVDPHVHFHVLPRYKGSRTFEGHEFLDPGWPGLPDFSKNQVASATLIEAIKLGWQSLS